MAPSAILIFSLELLAVAHCVSRDVWLATVLQLLVLLVAYLDALDRRLPGVLEQPVEPRRSPVDSQ